MPPKMGKTDAYLLQSFRSLAAMPRDVFADLGPAPMITMLIRLRDPDKFTPPNGFELLSRIGDIISGRGTIEAFEELQGDANVLGIEASRPVNTHDSAPQVPAPGPAAAPAAPALAAAAAPAAAAAAPVGAPAGAPSPLTFVRAADILGAMPGETGDQALVAVVDVGINVLHETFRDAAGACRIVEVWDQNDVSGPGPHSLYPGLTANYGTLHTAEQIAGYIAANKVPIVLGSGQPHGTHVASIAAGRPFGTPGTGAFFGGGVAPNAKIVVVVTKTDTAPGDPLSLGYSTSHCAALEYVHAVAERLKMPLVVNVSQGMNAGAHDGTSLLEAAFDQFTRGGRAPGLAVVKAAGNERAIAGHARVALLSNSADAITWQSEDVPHTRDIFELWFEACDEFKFKVVDPTGESSGTVTWANPDLATTLPSKNLVDMSYTRYHYDNGDSRLVVTIDIGSGDNITAGEWRLEIESGRVVSDGIIDAWLERDNKRPVVFTSHLEEEGTLSIPGTARTVISVGAVPAAFPLRPPPFTSFGPTRDRRSKPEVVAPGVDIVGADSRSPSGCRTDSGTSFAAPHVTGAIALLFSHLSKQNATLPNAAQIRAALTQQTQNFSGRFTPSGGYGVIDVQALLNAFS